VDWIKHCFVCKFNSLPYPLYTKFRSILAADFIAGGLRVRHQWPPCSGMPRSSVRANSRLEQIDWCGDGGLQLDNNYAVSQRVGFISLPLGCLVRLASPLVLCFDHR
jgi:hypothetical protein